MLAARDLVVMARRRAGLSQKQLAAKLQRPQSTVARWELGEMEPSYDAVMRTLAACGLEMTWELCTADRSYQYDVGMQMRLAPAARLERLGGRGRLAVAREIAAIAPASILIGDTAGALVGWPLSLPRDEAVEVCPAATELDALRALPGVTVIERPRGTRGWRDLDRDARSIDIDDTVRVASPLDLLRIEQARAHRTQALGLQAVVEYERRWPDGPPQPEQYTEAEARARIDAWLTRQQTTA